MNDQDAFSDLSCVAYVHRSAGVDGAVVVFIDTAFEPDGSDGGPGLRVSINDAETYVGVSTQ